MGGQHTIDHDPSRRGRRRPAFIRIRRRYNDIVYVTEVVDCVQDALAFG
jgi:hypothetical protein